MIEEMKEEGRERGREREREGEREGEKEGEKEGGREGGREGRGGREGVRDLTVQWSSLLDTSVSLHSLGRRGYCCQVCPYMGNHLKYVYNEKLMKGASSS